MDQEGPGVSEATKAWFHFPNILNAGSLFHLYKGEIRNMQEKNQDSAHFCILQLHNLNLTDPLIWNSWGK